MAYLFKSEMSSMHQSAETIQRELEALIENYLRHDMDLFAIGVYDLQVQARLMDAKLFIMLNACNHLGRTYWKRPNLRLQSSIGWCWAFLNRVQERLNKICHESSEERVIQTNLCALIVDWCRFCIALRKSGLDLKRQFSRRKKVVDYYDAFLN